MSKGAFTDPQHPPTPRQVSLVLGDSRAGWNNLVKHLQESHRAKGELKFYGRNYGWAFRYRRGGKNLVALYPGRGVFTVQVILPEGDVGRSRQLKLSRKTRGAIEAAHPFPEGRWVYLVVATSRDVADVERLVALKSSPDASAHAGSRTRDRAT